MAVAIAHDPDHVAAVQRVEQHPLEHTPTRDDLHQIVRFGVEIRLDVGPAPAHVRADNHLIARHQASEPGEKHIGRMRGRHLVLGHVRDLPVAVAHNGQPLGKVKDVAIPTGRRIGRPLVAGKDHELAVPMKSPHRIVEPLPVLIVNLEIIALMRGKIHPRPVAGKSEVLLLRADADGSVGLGVQIPPVAVPLRRCFRNGDRIAVTAQAVRRRHQPSATQSAKRHPTPLDHDFPFPFPAQFNRPCYRRRIAPHILSFDKNLDRFPHHRLTRRYAHQFHGLASDNGKLGRIRHGPGHRSIGRIDENAEFMGRLDKGLHPNPRRTAAALAQDHGHRIAGREGPVVHINHHAPDHPRPLVSLGGKARCQLGRPIGLHRAISWRSRIAELGRLHIAGKALGDLNGAALVNTVATHGQGQSPLLVAAGHHRRARLQRRHPQPFPPLLFHSKLLYLRVVE